NELFEAAPHIFISQKNPLAKKDVVTLEDLEDYPRLTFEQGQFNSFYYSEEIFSTLPSPKSIQVSDRATLFNLSIGLYGYTLCIGILSDDLDDTEIVTVPRAAEDRSKVGWVVNIKGALSTMDKLFFEEMQHTTCHMR